MSYDHNIPGTRFNGKRYVVLDAFCPVDCSGLFAVSMPDLVADCCFECHTFYTPHITQIERFDEARKKSRRRPKKTRKES